MGNKLIFDGIGQIIFAFEGFRQQVGFRLSAQAPSTVAVLRWRNTRNLDTATKQLPVQAPPSLISLIQSGNSFFETSNVIIISRLKDLSTMTLSRLERSSAEGIVFLIDRVTTCVIKPRMTLLFDIYPAVGNVFFTF